jgi:hypothetical protein
MQVAQQRFQQEGYPEGEAELLQEQNFRAHAHLRVELVELQAGQQARHHQRDLQQPVVVPQKHGRVRAARPVGRQDVAGKNQNGFRNQEAEDTGGEEAPEKRKHRPVRIVHWHGRACAS